MTNLETRNFTEETITTTSELQSNQPSNSDESEVLIDFGFKWI